MLDDWHHDAMYIAPKWKQGSAWQGHIPFASWLTAILAPATIVELGAYKGTSYAAFCQAVVENGLPTKCFAVDTWAGDPHSGTYSEDVFKRLNTFNDAHFGAFSTLLRMPFDEAVAKFSDQSIDLLHIDGFHTYDAVKHDFETWLPKVSPGGVVLFHDTQMKDGDFGVWRFWQEVREGRKSIEFPHSFGLGVLFLGDDLPLKAQSLVDSAFEKTSNGPIQSFRRLADGVDGVLTSGLKKNDLFSKLMRSIKKRI